MGLRYYEKRYPPYSPKSLCGGPMPASLRTWGHQLFRQKGKMAETESHLKAIRKQIKGRVTWAWY